MAPSSVARLYASIAVRISRSACRMSCSRLRWYATSASGRAIEASSATMATVIISSMNVKPPHLAFLFIGVAVQRQVPASPASKESEAAA